MHTNVNCFPNTANYPVKHGDDELNLIRKDDVTTDDVNCVEQFPT